MSLTLKHLSTLSKWNMMEKMKMKMMISYSFLKLPTTNLTTITFTCLMLELMTSIFLLTNNTRELEETHA